MTPEMVGAVATGVTGLIAAFSAFSANRSRQTAQGTKYLRARNKSLEKQVVDLIAHQFKMEQLLAKKGMEVPPRPASLDELVSEDTTP